MSDNVVDCLMDRYGRLVDQKANYNITWDEISKFVLPHRGTFMTHPPLGARRLDNVLDSTAIQSNEFLAATLHGGLTDPSQQWFRLITKNLDLNQNSNLKVWLTKVTDAIIDILNNPLTGFSSQNHELFLDLLAYGTACMYIDRVPGYGIRFRAIHLSEIVVAEDMGGHIDTVFRKFEYTVRQAAQAWGPDQLSVETQKKLLESPDELINILHCVKPNESFDEESYKASKLPFSSYFIEYDTGHLIEEKGYHELPYLVPRWAKLIGEVYGRSPAWNALADIRMLNTMTRTVMRAAEKAVDPPMLMADDGVMLPLQTKPGGVNFGGIDPLNGHLRMRPLETGGNMQIGLEMLNDRKQAIRNAYFIDPLMFREGPQMTATEVRSRQEEKLRVIGPMVGRLKSEYLSLMIMRVYGLLNRANKIPKLPPDLVKLIEQEGMGIEYTAPLYKTYKGQQPLALQQTLEIITPMVQMNPSILDNLDLDNAVRMVADVYLPPELVVPMEQMQAKRQQQQQIQQQQLVAAQKELMARGQGSMPMSPGTGIVGGE